MVNREIRLGRFRGMRGLLIDLGRGEAGSDAGLLLDRLGVCLLREHRGFWIVRILCEFGRKLGLWRRSLWVLIERGGCLVLPALVKGNGVHRVL